MESKASEKSWDDELRELTLQFIARLPSRVVEMETALKTGHFDQVAGFAHRLSGAAGSYTLPALAAEARNLERVSHLKDIPSIRNSFDKIRALVTELTTTELDSNTRTTPQ